MSDMSMSVEYLNAIANHGRELITHIGLVNESGAAVGARTPVTWAAVDSGVIRPTGNLIFDVPAGTTVAGWRGYSALTAGTDYGGKAVTPRPFPVAGQYKLRADLTSIVHA